MMPHALDAGRAAYRAIASALSALVVVICIVSTLQAARAETPFLIEDPSTLPPGRWESFTSYQRDVNALGGTSRVPQVELHSGLRNDLLLHVDLPYEQIMRGTDARATGLGDLGIGLKYRFAQGKGDGLTAAFFPQMTIPTGNALTGLGSGKPTYEFPLWVQRTTGATTICVGGGFSLNPVPGGRTSSFGGLLVHRDFGSRWMLGAEVLAKGPESVDEVATTTVNLGASYHASPNFGFLARVGRTVSGRRADNIYVAIYRAWGRLPADDSSK
jgi:hypothetical protein